MKKTRTPSNTRQGKIKAFIKQKLINFRQLRCRANFSGYLELDHSSYKGNIDDIEWNIVEEWLLFLDCWNSAISSK